MPRFGRLYAAAVLRPLAEQVVGELGVRPGETACDLICDGGTLGSALGIAAGAGGGVVLVDTGNALVQHAVHEVEGSAAAVSAVTASGDTIPVAEASCDRVGSLLTRGFWHGDSLFDAAERITRRTGTAAIVAWDPADPPLHETALAAALGDVAGLRSRFLGECLSSAQAPAPRWEPVTLHEVVRFDGMAHYWAAMVAERPVAGELSGLPDAALVSVRTACERRLRSCTAADGTMLVPVRAIMWHMAGRG